MKTILRERKVMKRIFFPFFLSHLGYGFFSINIGFPCFKET